MTQHGRVVVVRVGLPGDPFRELSSVQEDGEPGFYLTARVKRSKSDSDDSAEIAVYNPGPRVLEVLQRRDDYVTELLAGYGGQRTLLAQGKVVRSSLSIEDSGGTRVARWQVTDSGRAIRGIRLSRAWSSVDALEVYEYILSESGLARGYIELGLPTDYPYGFVLSGGILKSLKILGRDTESTHSIVNGRLSVWPKAGQRKARLLQFAPDSGLIGSPSPRDNKRLQVTTLLAPSIQVGDRYGVQSAYWQGEYIVEDFEHAIDSGQGGPFTTTIIGRPA